MRAVLDPPDAKYIRSDTDEVCAALDLPIPSILTLDNEWLVKARHTPLAQRTNTSNKLIPVSYTHLTLPTKRIV